MKAIRVTTLLATGLVCGGMVPAAVQPAPAQPAPVKAPVAAPVPPAAVPPAPTAASPAPPVPAPSQAATADVSGFRSARFGMTQDQVREAIKADFSSEESEIKQGTNDQEKTRFLAVRIANLVPDSGMAVITYIFGYSSQKLIQVNVVWGKLAGGDPLPAELVSTGRLLQQYFLGQGFVRSTIVANRGTSNGSVILFNGFDDKKRSVMLVLDTMAVPGDSASAPPPKGQAKPPAKSADTKPGDKKTPPEMQLVASGLRLSYIENAANPDIFRIQRGKF